MIRSILSLALREIGRNIFRSSLTILGIVIGVAAVISMVTLGGGATKYITDEIQSLGSNLLIVRTGTRPGPGGVRSNAPPLKINDAEAIERDVSGIAAIAPSASATAIAVYGNENWSTTITGTTNGFLDVREWDVNIGRRFTESEIKAGKLVCILGETVRKELFGHQNPIGATIRLGTVSCQIIGVLDRKENQRLEWIRTIRSSCRYVLYSADSPGIKIFLLIYLSAQRFGYYKPDSKRY